MGNLKDLQKERDRLERDVAERQARLRARFTMLGRNARERFSVTALVVTGVIAGIALEQYVRIKARTRKPKVKIKHVPVQRIASVPLMSVLQFALTALLAPKAARRASSSRRRAPHAPEVSVQSARSTSRDDHSNIRTDQGLTRH